MIREEEPPRPSQLSARWASRRDRLPASRGGPAAAEPTAAGRPGLDRDEGPGEGPHAALRVGQRPGGGRPAVSAPRAGRGPPADAGRPGGEMGSAASRRSCGQRRPPHLRCRGCPGGKAAFSCFAAYEGEKREARRGGRRTRRGSHGEQAEAQKTNETDAAEAVDQMLKRVADEEPSKIPR